MGIKLALVMGAILLAMSTAFGWYYQNTQARISVLIENNAKLETAVDVAESSLDLLQLEYQKTAELNKELQVNLQKAEQYGDKLRNTLQRLDLVQDALNDPDDLQGRMNGATAKVWRGIMDESGNDNEYPLPGWLLNDSRTENTDGNEDREDNSTDSSSSETADTN